MTRIRTLFSVVLPSMLAGGVVFGGALGYAATGDPDLGFWPAPVVVAQADPKPAPPRRPAPAPAPAPSPAPPPAPPGPRGPVPPPAPPALPSGVNGWSGVSGNPGKHGVGVTINNGKIEITGVRELVKSQLDAARAAIRANPHIPPDVRAKIVARLDKVGATIDKRMANLKLTDLSSLDDEMERMGEEIEQALEGLDDDLDKIGVKLGKDFAKTLGNVHVAIDHDDDDDDDHDDDDIDTPPAPDVADTDDSDMREAISDLKDMAVHPAQRDKIAKLRADSDRAVAESRKHIERLSEQLHTALGNPNISDAEIGKLVDQISSHEASMRKARILAWAQARRELTAAQRKRIEDAAAKVKVKAKTK